MENQAAGSSCLCVWPYLWGREVTLQPPDGERVLTSTRTSWAGDTSQVSSPPSASLLPPFLWLALRRSQQPSLGANWVYLALKIHASCGEASTTVPMEKIQLVTTSLTKKPKTFCLIFICRNFGSCFPVRLKLMFASPPLPMTEQHTLIDFSHQSIYFYSRTLSPQTNEGLHKKSSASVWQQTGIFLFILNPNFCG